MIYLIIVTAIIVGSAIIAGRLLRILRNEDSKKNRFLKGESHA